MGMTVIIAKHELLKVLRRRTFLVLSFGMPLLAGLVVLVVNLTTPPAAESLASIVMPKPPQAPQGYVDHAGLIDAIPEPLSASFVRFRDEAEARAAAERGEVDGFLVVPADFIAEGRLLFYDRDFSPLSSDDRVSAFRYLLLRNLVDDDSLAPLLWQPAAITELNLDSREQTDTGTMATFWLPYVVVMILVFSLSMASGWLLQSIGNEKDTRVLEIMLSSASPVQVLAGKTIGLGLAGLVQLALWLLAATVLIAVGRRGLSIPAGFGIPVASIPWTVAYFVLGYSVYASLICSLGALAPTLRDANSVTFLVYLPLIVPLWLMNALTSQPNGTVSVVLSIFPLTSPAAMVIRLVQVAPPAWQMLSSSVLLLLTAYGVIRLAARLFRAQTLLSGQALSIKNLRAALTND